VHHTDTVQRWGQLTTGPWNAVSQIPISLLTDQATLARVVCANVVVHSQAFALLSTVRRDALVTYRKQLLVGSCRKYLDLLIDKSVSCSPENTRWGVC